MSNPFLPATPIALPSQRIEFAIKDEANNPSDPYDPHFNVGLWPPSIHCDEEADTYVLVTVPKKTDVTSAVKVRINGAFLFDAYLENTTATPLLHVLAWPQFYFNVYVGDDPETMGVNTPTATSSVLGPYVIANWLEAFDGYIDLNGPSGGVFPAGYGPFTLHPTSPGLDIDISDPAVLGLFDGASGDVNVYIKPMAAAPSQSTDGGSTWTSLGSSGIVGGSKERFLGTGYVEVTRS